MGVFIGVSASEVCSSILEDGRGYNRRSFNDGRVKIGVT